MKRKEFKINGYTVRLCEEHKNYAVSGCGRVFRISTGKQMSQFLGGVPQYWYTRVSQDGKARTVRVHRMIALAWIDNDDPANRNTVNHINGDKLDNAVGNLEWVTLARNNQHGCTLEGNYGQELYNSTLTEELAHILCKRLEEGARSLDLSREYNLSKDVVRKLKAGDTYFHIRQLYSIPHKYVSEFSTNTVIWVCDRICQGLSDQNIAKTSTNDKLKVIDVKRIRHKIRYRDISDLYF